MVAAPAGSAAAPDIAEFLAALPKWSTSVAVKTGYGFKDNLLLSHVGEERSAFARGSMEFLLLRVPQGSFDYMVFAELEGTHYFTAKTSDRDAKVWVRTEPAYRLGESVKLSLPVTGYYYDQVFDVSDTDVDRRVAELKVRGGMIGPVARWDFLPTWSIEAQAVGQRKRYDDGANDGHIGEGVATLGWRRHDWLEVRVSGARRWRDYDRRTQYSAAGRELAGTTLKIAERDLEARFDVTWDTAAHWQTSTRVNRVHYGDNGSGYFNYREQKIGQDVEWRNDAWLVRIAGSASRVDFSVQTVGLGTEPPARITDDFTAGIHAERKLTSRWTVYGSYSWERSRSNDVFASYVVNEGLLGLRWSWEK